ncbi:PREDICTED: uncharacterized protein LOC105569645 [Vollenhovia emeryi]|uniref:uncharacterized protein LOC105569645 n=1 Tax=Vollenhovia emeryi TaxID=411798 RepID=UPI0005F55597|nr:PREDICTED: uncharacterized protein LOC105569645 [Vollenhovia emeryi]XP_011881664.1 PREDICTED: uncharacterized protein LOC105569645 [Vollenhovia emeryi]
MEDTLQKESRRYLKRKRRRSKDDDATQSNGNTLAAGIVLNCYYLLRNIFHHLNGKDLTKAAMVCRSWSEAATKEKLVRRNPCRLAMCKKRQKEYCYQELLGYISNLRIVPRIGFWFLSTQSLSWKEKESIKNLLPECWDIICLNSQGIIDSRGTDRCSPYNSVCTFLPEIPNVRMKTFTLTNDFVNEYQEIVNTIVNHNKTSVSHHETSTCLMLFFEYESTKLALRWASKLQNSKEIKIDSVLGSKFRRNWYTVNMTKPTHVRRSCICVVITGSIKTWSTILADDCNTEMQIEASLKLFKDKVKLKKHSVGFMLISVPYLEDPYDESDKILKIFTRLFPEVPVAGSFGSGLFGLPTVDGKNEKEESKKSESWYQKHGTEFLILTYD